MIPPRSYRTAAFTPSIKAVVYGLLGTLAAIRRQAHSGPLFNLESCRERASCPARTPPWRECAGLVLPLSLSMESRHFQSH